MIDKDPAREAAELIAKLVERLNYMPTFDTHAATGIIRSAFAEALEDSERYRHIEKQCEGDGRLLVDYPDEPEYSVEIVSFTEEDGLRAAIDKAREGGDGD